MRDCIETTATKTRQGYGQVRHNKQMVGAHRVAYCKHHGIDISTIKGLVVRHTCDNPPCINPAHLVIGTVSDNNRDAIERGRHRSAPKERNGNAKLTEAQVQQIRAEYKRGSVDRNVYTLAKKFGIGKSMVHLIVTGKNWNEQRSAA